MDETSWECAICIIYTKNQRYQLGKHANLAPQQYKKISPEK